MIGYIPNNTTLFSASATLNIQQRAAAPRMAGADTPSEIPTGTPPGPTAPYYHANVFRSPANYKIIASREFPQFTVIAETSVHIDNDIIHGLPGYLNNIAITANQDGYIVKAPGYWEDTALPKNTRKEFYSDTLDVDFSGVKDFSNSQVKIDVDYIAGTLAPDTPSPDTPSPDTPSPDIPSPDTPSPDTPSPDTVPPDTPSPGGPTGDGTTGIPYALRNFKLLEENE